MTIDRIARKHHHASEAVPLLEGEESLKGTGAFDSKRQRIAYNVSFLGGGGESVKVRGAGGRGNRCTFFVKYEDPSQCVA